MFRRLNFLGESKKDERERRIEALEVHIQELNERLAQIVFDHLREFHHGQEGYIPEPKES